MTAFLVRSWLFLNHVQSQNSLYVQNVLLAARFIFPRGRNFIVCGCTFRTPYRPLLGSLEEMRLHDVREKMGCS